MSLTTLCIDAQGGVYWGAIVRTFGTVLLIGPDRHLNRLSKHFIVCCLKDQLDHSYFLCYLNRWYFIIHL